MTNAEQAIVNYLRKDRLERYPEDYPFEANGAGIHKDNPYCGGAHGIAGNDQWLMALSVIEYDPDKYALQDIVADDYGVTNTRNAGMYKDTIREAVARISKDGIPTHVARVVARSAWFSLDEEDQLTVSDKPVPLSLVDGEVLYLTVSADGTVESIWEELWVGDQPSYYGGPIDEAIQWCEEIAPVCYTQLDNPFAVVE